MLQPSYFTVHFHSFTGVCVVSANIVYTMQDNSFDHHEYSLLYLPQTKKHIPAHSRYQSCHWTYWGGLLNSDGKAHTIGHVQGDRDGGCYSPNRRRADGRWLGPSTAACALRSAPPNSESLRTIWWYRNNAGAQIGLSRKDLPISRFISKLEAF